MAHRSQQDRVAAAETIQLRVGQDLAGSGTARPPGRTGKLVFQVLEPATSASTARLSAITSGPTPSPGITPILNKIPSRLGRY